MGIKVRSVFATAYAALIAAAGLVGPAAAQQPPAAGSMPPPAQPGPAMGQQMMQQGMDRGRMGMGMGQSMVGPGMMDGGMMSMMGAGAQHTEGRLAFFKTELKITDAQVPQWNAFADAVRANASGMTEMGRSMMAAHKGMGTTLPERLASEDKVVSAHLAALKKVEESLDKLYGVLSPEQKKLADGIVIGPMGMPMDMMPMDMK